MPSLQKQRAFYFFYSYRLIHELGGSLKRSLGMAFPPIIPKAFGFEDPTLSQFICKFRY